MKVKRIKKFFFDGKLKQFFSMPAIDGGLFIKESNHYKIASNVPRIPEVATAGSNLSRSEAQPGTRCYAMCFEIFIHYDSHLTFIITFPFACFSLIYRTASAVSVSLKLLSITGRIFPSNTSLIINSISSALDLAVR